MEIIELDNKVLLQGEEVEEKLSFNEAKRAKLHHVEPEPPLIVVVMEANSKPRKRHVTEIAENHDLAKITCFMDQKDFKHQ